MRDARSEGKRTTRFCGQCGAQASIDAHYCDACGEPLGVPIEPNAPTHAGLAETSGRPTDSWQRVRSSPTWISWVAGLGVVVIAVVAVVALRVDSIGPFGGHEWPDDVQENFMNSCTFLGDDAICECALDRLQDRYSLEEFNRLEVRTRTNRQLPSAVTDIIADCRLRARSGR